MNSNSEEPGLALKTNNIRRILSQVLACMSKNFLLLEFAMIASFPTIAIPYLRGIQKTNDGDDDNFVITDQEVTWFASIYSVVHPIGSILSGFFLEKFGPKKGMIIATIPHVIAWTLFYYTQHITTLLLASFAVGIGLGLSEAPASSYVAEITEPSLRGVLVTIGGVFDCLGFTFIFLFGTIMTWRNIAILGILMLVIIIIIICINPESPIRLLSQNRREDALKALQRLRGWKLTESVIEEFNQIENYVKTVSKCSVCDKDFKTCEHKKQILSEKIKALLEKNTLRPFFVIFALFIFSQFSLYLCIIPYFIQILDKYNLPIASDWIMSMVGIANLLGIICCVIFIKILGKRKVGMISSIAIFICSCFLSVYSWYYLPFGLVSFDKNNFAINNGSYIPVVLFLALPFSTTLGTLPLPWIMLCELFPNKTRGLAIGISAASSYLMRFLAAKTYYDLETCISTAGVIVFFTFISLLNFLFIYFCLPETEGRTLQEIERHFSKKDWKITTTHISKENN